MMHLESAVSDATIWSVTLDSSITILEASFTLIYVVYTIGISYDNCQWLSIDNCSMFILQATAYLPKCGVFTNLLNRHRLYQEGSHWPTL